MGSQIPRDDPGRTDGERDATSDAPTHDVGRRALLVRGLVAAPLIATLFARPARAGWQTGSLGAYDYGGNDCERTHDGDCSYDPWNQGHDDWRSGGRRRRR